MDTLGEGIRPSAMTKRRFWLSSVALSAVFSRDVLLSLASALLDIALFALAIAFGLKIMMATFLARIASAVFNFLGSKHLVFRSVSQHRVAREAVSYGVLALVLVCLSAWLVRELHGHSHLQPALCKLLIDGGLFILAFSVKRFAVFRPRSPASRSAALPRPSLSD